VVTENVYTYPMDVTRNYKAISWGRGGGETVTSRGVRKFKLKKPYMRLGGWVFPGTTQPGLEVFDPVS